MIQFKRFIAFISVLLCVSPIYFLLFLESMTRRILRQVLFSNTLTFFSRLIWNSRPVQFLFIINWVCLHVSANCANSRLQRLYTRNIIFGLFMLYSRIWCRIKGCLIFLLLWMNHVQKASYALIIVHIKGLIYMANGSNRRSCTLRILSCGLLAFIITFEFIFILYMNRHLMLVLVFRYGILIAWLHIFLLVTRLLHIQDIHLLLIYSRE